MEIRYFCCRQDQMYNNRQNKNNIMTTDAIMKMKDGMLRELTGNILPFWMEKMEDRIHGGFLGRISGKGLRSIKGSDTERKNPVDILRRLPHSRET